MELNYEIDVIIESLDNRDSDMDIIYEGFKDVAKSIGKGALRAGKFVGKTLAKSIDFLINVVRQMANVFRNILRKIAGKEAIRIEDKSIFQNFIKSLFKMKKVKVKMEKIVDPKNAEVIDSATFDLEKSKYKAITKLEANHKEFHTAMNEAIKESIELANEMDVLGKQIDEAQAETSGLLNELNDLLGDMDPEKAKEVESKITTSLNGMSHEEFDKMMKSGKPIIIG